MFAVVWHQCLPSMPCNGERANMTQYHVRHQCTAAIVFRATRLKLHDVYRRVRQFSHWFPFVMRLCLKGSFQSKNLVILSDLDSDSLSVEADTTSAPWSLADRTEMLTKSATQTKEQHISQVSSAPSEFPAHVCEIQRASSVATGQRIKAICGSTDPISPPTKLFQIYFTESPIKVSKVKSING